MKSTTREASARQRSGGPSPVLGRRGHSNDRPRGADIIAEVDRQIAELGDRSTHELRIAWRQFHRSEPPQGLSRDLMIRGLANQLQERADWRLEPGSAAPPPASHGRVRERHSFLPSRSRVEARQPKRNAVASTASTPPAHDPANRRRVGSSALGPGALSRSESKARGREGSGLSKVGKGVSAIARLGPGARATEA